MDVAYDHTFTDDVSVDEKGKGKSVEPAVPTEQESLNEELQQAYKAISNSPWGARLGAFVGTVKKQGESYYDAARKEYPTAVKGFGDLRTNLVARTRALSLSSAQQEGAEKGEGAGPGLFDKIKKGVAEIEAVEARADEYLLKFGTSIGGFLRDAITIAPPAAAEGEEGEKGEVVFEAAKEGGKKQIFTTRLDAQLHLLHTNHALFKADPAVDNFPPFTSSFSADKETSRIAADLEKYPELRATMEALVPDEVEYTRFWIRYYFLRSELDLEEKRRKELLKGAAIEEEEVGWDEDDSEEDDSDDSDGDSEDEEDGADEGDGADEEDGADDEEPAKPDAAKPAVIPMLAPKASTDTLQPQPQTVTKPKTSSDSEASYDVVSGAPSQVAGSPSQKGKPRDESSDEEADWE